MFLRKQAVKNQLIDLYALLVPLVVARQPSKEHFSLSKCHWIHCVSNYTGFIIHLSISQSIYGIVLCLYLY